MFQLSKRKNVKWPSPRQLGLSYLNLCRGWWIDKFKKKHRNGRKCLGTAVILNKGKANHFFEGTWKR